MEKKLRHSRQRDMIYQYLMTSHDHPTAETVHSDLKAEIQGLSLGTVYRNLKLLEELGKIRRVSCSQGIERYDARCGDHVHFLCQHCGCVRDVDEVNSDAIQSAVSLEDGYQLKKMDLTLTGICPACTGI